MTRRDFIQRTGTGVVAAAAGGCAARPVTLDPMVVDTHTHFYDPTRPGGVPWPPANSPLYRTVLPSHWQAVARPHGVTHTVVVEASVRVDDNHWILDLAAREKSIIGFVGHLDPMDAAFGLQVKQFARNPVFRGIRRSGPAVLGNLSEPVFLQGLKQLADLGLQLDVNGLRPGAHAQVAALARRLPDLRIVVNHVGNAGDPQKLPPEWRDGMKALGACPNVFCKVSGLIEQTVQSSSRYGTAPRETEYYRPVLDHCWESFGEDRLIFGSNWPVSDKGGSYADQFRIVDEFFTWKGRAAREKYFSRNSFVAYRWVRR